MTGFRRQPQQSLGTTSLEQGGGISAELSSDEEGPGISTWGELILRKSGDLKFASDSGVCRLQGQEYRPSDHLEYSRSLNRPRRKETPWSVLRAPQLKRCGMCRCPEEAKDGPERQQRKVPCQRGWGGRLRDGTRTGVKDRRKEGDMHRAH